MIFQKIQSNRYRDSSCSSSGLFRFVPTAFYSIRSVKTSSELSSSISCGQSIQRRRADKDEGETIKVCRLLCDLQALNEWWKNVLTTFIDRLIHHFGTHVSILEAKLTSPTLFLEFESSFTDVGNLMNFNDRFNFSISTILLTSRTDSLWGSIWGRHTKSNIFIKGTKTSLTNVLSSFLQCPKAVRQGHEELD